MTISLYDWFHIVSTKTLEAYVSHISSGQFSNYSITFIEASLPGAKLNLDAEICIVYGIPWATSLWPVEFSISLSEIYRSVP